MAGPGGKEVGRVTVRVSPDTSRFASQLYRELRAETRKPVQVDVEPDTKGLREKVKAAAQRARTSTTVDVKVNDKALKKLKNVDFPDGSGRRSGSLLDMFRDANREAEKLKKKVDGITTGSFSGDLTKEIAEEVRKNKFLYRAFGDKGQEAGIRFRRGFLRGFTGIRIDRTLMERIGFGLGRGLLMPVTQLSRLAGMATLATVALGPLAGAMAGVGGAAVGLGTGLAQASGALALIPALASGAAAGIATLVAGFKGVGNALGAETPAELEKALDRLTPNARKAVKAFRALRPEFQLIRRTVQQNLFAGLDRQIAKLSTSGLLRALRVGMNELAQQFNGMMRDAFDVFTSSSTVNDVKAFFRDLARGARSARPGMKSLAQAFVDLTAVGGRLMPRLGRAFTNLAKRFEKGISTRRASGQLEDMLNTALDAISQLGRIAKNVFGTIKNVWKAAEDAGGGLLNTVEKVSAAVKDFTGSARGQERLRTVFESIRRAGEAMSPVFKRLGSTLVQLSPIIAGVVEAIAPALEQIIGAFGDAFEDIGPELGPILKSIGESISRILPPLVKLIPPFLRLLDAVLKPMIPVVEALAPIIGALANAIAGLLNAVTDSGVAQIAALGAGILALGKALKKLPKIGPIAKGLALLGLGGKAAKGAKGAKGAARSLPPIVGGFNKTSKAAGKASKSVGGFWKTVGRGAKAGVTRLPGIGLVLTGLDLIPSGVSKAGESLSILEVGLVGLQKTGSAVAAIVTGNKEAWHNLTHEKVKGQAVANQKLVELWQNEAAAASVYGKKTVEAWKRAGVDINAIGREIRWNQFVDTWREAFGPMLGHVNTIAEGVRKRFSGMGSTISSVARGVASRVSEHFNSIGNSASRTAAKANSSAWSIGSFWSRVTSGMVSKTNTMGSRTGGVWNRIKNIAGRSMSSIGSFADKWFRKEIPNSAKSGARDTANAFSGLSGWISSAVGDVSSVGSSIVHQVANGIWSAITFVRNAAAGIGAAIRYALPNSPAKYGPLSGKGYPLILGRNVSNFVARGIREATPAVRMASKDLAGSVRANLTSKAMGRDSAYSLGAQWVRSYADGIESQSARATKAVGTLMRSATGLDSEVSAALSADGFQSIPDQIADAMSGWEFKQNRDATWYMYKRTEKSRSRR